MISSISVTLEMIKFFSSIKIAFCVLTMCFVISPALAQNQNADLIANQLSRIQRDLQALNRQVFKNSANGNQSKTYNNVKGSSSNNAYIIRVEDRLSQLENAIKENTNTVENNANTLNQISARLDSLGNDINFRITSIEQRLNFLTRNPQAAQQDMAFPSSPSSVQPLTPPRLTAVPRPKGVHQIGTSTGGITLGNPQGTLGTITQRDLNTARRQNSANAIGTIDQALRPTNLGAAVSQQSKLPESNLPAGTPKEQYKFAFGLVRKQEFSDAVKALEEFIKTYPAEPLTTNARNWLGRTHYVRKDYRSAIEVFLAAYKVQPKGKKAADNLFRLGLSLAALKKNKEACTTFYKLDQDFPDSNSIIKKQLVLQRKKIGCG